MSVIKSKKLRESARNEACTVQMSYNISAAQQITWRESVVPLASKSTIGVEIMTANNSSSNVVGRKVEMLTVVKHLVGGEVCCVCDCGNYRNVKTGHFNTGKIKSCGCHVAIKRAKLKSRTCSQEGCEKSVKNYGMCEMHYYRIRRNGSVLTLQDQKRNFLAYLVDNPTSECVIWPYSKKPEGYGSYSIKGDESITAHRAALIMLTGENPQNMVAAHGPCNNRLCVNPHPEHGMKWATHYENNIHRHRDGTMPIGERHHNSKLTEPQVIEIRMRASRGEVLSLIAKDYGVTGRHLRAVVKGEFWSHV